MLPIVYSSPSCAPCKILKKWLTDNNIPFDERGVDSALSEGFRSVPVLVYRGNTYFGPTEKQLKEIFPV